MRTVRAVTAGRVVRPMIAVRPMRAVVILTEMKAVTAGRVVRPMIEVRAMRAVVILRAMRAVSAVRAMGAGRAV